MGGGDGVSQNSVVFNFSDVPILQDNYDSGSTVTVNPFTVAYIEYDGSGFNTVYTRNLYPPTMTLNALSVNALSIVSVTETKATPAINSNVLTLNLSSATFFSVNLNQPITTFTLTNIPASPKVYSFTLQLVADGTARAVTWPTGTRWSGGTLPTLTTSANKVDTFVFMTHNGGTEWYAHMVNTDQ
jgi:hypothetical protein